MPRPTNPRKQSLMPSTTLRRALRSAGHALAPIVQIGKLGVTESVVAQVTRALLDHELIKIKLGTESPESRFEVAERLGSEPDVKVAQILGRTVLLYKHHPKKAQFEKGDASPDRKPKPAARLAGKSSRKSSGTSSRKSSGRSSRKSSRKS